MLIALVNCLLLHFFVQLNSIKVQGKVGGAFFQRKGNFFWNRFLPRIQTSKSKNNPPFEAIYCFLCLECVALNLALYVNGPLKINGHLGIVPEAVNGTKWVVIRLGNYLQTQLIESSIYGQNCKKIWHHMGPDSAFVQESVVPTFPRVDWRM